MTGVVDLYLVYEFLKRLTTPFDKTQAFALGLIDADGVRLRKPETQVERKALGYYDKLVFNLKRLLATVPGGKTQLASFAASLLLLRERDERYNSDIKYLRAELQKAIANLSLEEYNYLSEEMGAVAIANSTGPHVNGPGTNGDGIGRKLKRVKRAGRKIPVVVGLEEAKGLGLKYRYRNN